MCHLCGREFGLTSLEIHFKSCKNKWDSSRTMPEPPAQLDQILRNPSSVTAHQLESYNNEAFDIYNKASLVSCPGCSRTFLPDRLQVHLRSCKNASSSSPRKESTPSKGPNSLVCYLCGRGYMKASIKIHLQKCQQAFVAEEAKKPESQRRKVPRPPDLLLQILNSDKVDTQIIEEYNEVAFRQYNDKALVRCDACSRTFLPQSLATHQKSCKGSSKADLSSVKKQPSRPRTLMCYICGREFGTTSLQIHLKACKKKWEVAESLKPANQRRPLPQPPKNFEQILSGAAQLSSSQLEDFNNEAFKDYNEKALVKCPNCPRTFLPDRLDVHLRSCKGAQNRGEYASTSSYPSQPKSVTAHKSPSRPKTLICYIWQAGLIRSGREYGTASLKIHLKSCKDKWELEESKKPKHQRRPLPEEPKNFEQIVARADKMSANQLENFNNEAFTDFNQKALVKCPNCPRTFLPDRLEIHLRSCKGAAGTSPMPNGKRSPIDKFSTPSKPPPLSGREYGTASLKIHLKSCKEKWEIQESKKPKHLRRPLPEEPKNFDQVLCSAGKMTSNQLQNFNSEAFNDYNEKALLKCPNCPRTFLPERLEVHLRSCKGSGSAAHRALSPPSVKTHSFSPKPLVRPKTLLCYIWQQANNNSGREYGTASLKIHLKSCKDKWEIAESKKPKHQRRPLPQEPQNFQEIVAKADKLSANQLQNFNNDAFNDYNEKALVKCPNCPRTFLPDRLEVHLRSCKGPGGMQAASASPVPHSKRMTSPPPAVRPKTLICYLCGREYGTASLKIHIKSCREKWEIAESKKPAHLRRPIPDEPKQFDAVLANAGAMSINKLQNFNQAAFQDFNQKALEQCPNCSRTFLPDRLIVHLRSCKARNSSNNIGYSKSSQGLPPIRPPSSPTAKLVSRPRTIVCYLCGRQYGTSSLQIHLRSCKQKWEEQESKKPPGMRRPLPLEPQDLTSVAKKGSRITLKELEAYNNTAFNDYNQKALVPCVNCGRTFLPDRLEIHIRSCKPRGEI